MAEAAKSVYDYLGEGENLIYINFASLDPVALDQACVDFLYAVPDGESVIARMQSRTAFEGKIVCRKPLFLYFEFMRFGCRVHRCAQLIKGGCI